MKTGRILRCIRGQFLYLPTFAGKLNGTSKTRPTGFWDRCVEHEKRYRETGKCTAAAVLRRLMASIYEKTLQDGSWRTGVEGLRRYYRTAPPQFQCNMSRRAAYQAIEVLRHCGMIERGLYGLRATDDFCRMQVSDDGLSITPERLRAVPICLLTPTFPEAGETCIDLMAAGIARIDRDRALGVNPWTATKRERELAQHCGRMRRYRADSPRERHGDGVAVKSDALARTDVTLSRELQRVVAGSSADVGGDFQSPLPGGESGTGGIPRLILIGKQPQWLPLTKKAVRGRKRAIDGRR